MNIIESATVLSQTSDRRDVLRRAELALKQLEATNVNDSVPGALIAQMFAGVVLAEGSIDSGKLNLSDEDGVPVHGSRVITKIMDDGVRVTDKFG
jgi:hypothetical protein